MMRLNRKRSLALGCVAAFAVSAVPQLARAEEPAVTETKDDGVTVKEEQKAVKVANAWSTRGGATLGSGMALHAEFTAASQQNINSGYLNLGAGLIVALGENFDLVINLRVPLVQLGLSPGAGIRLRLIDDAQFHLSLVGNVQVPMIYVPGFWIGLSVEPGLMMSYFFSDRTELYSGLLFAWTPLFANPWVPGTGNMGFAGTFRIGFAYTLAVANMGFFINADVGAGYEPVRRFILIGERASGLAFNAALTVGSQFKF